MTMNNCKIKKRFKTNQHCSILVNKQSRQGFALKPIKPWKMSLQSVSGRFLKVQRSQNWFKLIILDTFLHSDLKWVHELMNIFPNQCEISGLLGICIMLDELYCAILCFFLGWALLSLGLPNAASVFCLLKHWNTFLLACGWLQDSYSLEHVRVKTF